MQADSKYRIIDRADLFLFGLILFSVSVGFALGVLFQQGLTPEASTNEPLYRKHMIRNNIAEWVINQDGKNVLVLKGNRDYEKREKSK